MLSEFRSDTPSNAGRDAVYRDTLNQALDGQVDYYAEYIDAPESAGADYALALRDLLRVKYRAKRIDLVIAVGEEAVRFAQSDGAEIFPAASVVGANVDRSVLEAARRAPGLPVTGVARQLDVRGTVQLIRTLQPDVNTIAFIAGGAHARHLEALAREQLSDHDGRLALNYWIDLTMEEWLARVTKLPSKTAVVYLAVVQDATGKRLLPTDALKSITSRSAVPVYAIVGNYIDYGIVGGSLYNPDALAREVAALAARVLRGEPARDIAVVDSRSNFPTISRTALRRWGLSELRLPAGTVITHIERSIWERYQWPIVGTLILLALALMITGLVVQRARRRDSEERNAAILRALPDMMFLMTRDGTYVDFHAPDQATLLVKPEQFLGRRMRDLLPQHVACRFEDSFTRLVPGQPPMVIEYRLPMPGGERDYEARLVASQNDRVLAIVRDITERRHAETALTEAQSDLSRLSRLTALGEFAASIAHEIRQPLTAIILNARSGLRRISGAAPDLAEVRAGLLDIVADGQRAGEVIRRNRALLEEHTMEAAPLDVNAVIRDAIVMAETRLTASEVAVTSSLADDLPATSGDRIELQQVLLNLIANAIDAMEGVERGARRIHVSSLFTPEQFVRVDVRDNGVGLEGVDVHRMFRISYTTKAGGTGVGLSISRAIVEAHGGRLWAEQNAASGATFCFTIPVRSTLAAAHATGAQPQAI